MLDLADLSLADLDADPEPILAQMREDAPVCWVPALAMWFVTRWDDVQYVDDHPELFTANTDPSFLARALGPNMMTADPPVSTRTRSAMLPSFQPRGVSGEFVKNRLATMANDLLDGFAADGRTELMAAYAEPLSAGALADVLGLGSHGAAAMWRWCSGLCADIANFENDPAKRELGDETKAELGAVIAARIEELRAADGPIAGGGALADFVAANPEDGPLTADEILNNVRLMISGGINEPRDGIGLVIWVLLTEPHLLEAVTDQPDLWRRLVEEVFRRYSPVGTITRQATVDTEVAGVAIPAGQLVSGVIRSANLDETHFANPIRIDLHRSERGHAAFSTGPHRCLGEWLGRQEVRVGAQRVMARLPDLKLDGPVELTGFEFRGPRALPLRWTAP